MSFVSNVRVKVSVHRNIGAFSQALPVATISGTQDTRKERVLKKITSYIVIFFISSYFVDCKKSK